jgi:hypothetical protein
MNVNHRFASQVTAKQEQHVIHGTLAITIKVRRCVKKSRDLMSSHDGDIVFRKVLAVTVDHDGRILSRNSMKKHAQRVGLDSMAGRVYHGLQPPALR